MAAMYARSMEIISVIVALVFAHVVFDFPLQGEFLARAKNRHAPIPHIPWWQAMFAHCFMHACAVYLILGVWWLGVLEFIAHFIIDMRKCDGELTFNHDQALHYLCKAIWLILAVILT